MASIEELSETFLDHQTTKIVALLNFTKPQKENIFINYYSKTKADLVQKIERAEKKKCKILIYRNQKFTHFL